MQYVPSHSKRVEYKDDAIIVTKFLFKWTFIIGVISMILSVTSVGAYFVYYQWTMPSMFTIAQPLHFDYQHPSHVLDDSNDVHLHYHIDSAEVYIPSLIQGHRSHMPTAMFVLPPGILDSRAGYSFSMGLKLADSPVNRQVGMFMMRMSLRNDEGAILKEASRPAMVPYRSWLHKMLRMFILVVPSLLGVYEETYEMTTNFFELYKEDSYDPLRTVQISFSHPDIQLYSATLYISTRLYGIAYALHHYFVLTSFVILGICFFMQWGLILFLVSLWKIRSWQKESDAPANMPIREHLVDKLSTESDRFQHLRRTSDLYSLDEQEMNDEYHSVSEPVQMDTLVDPELDSYSAPAVEETVIPSIVVEDTESPPISLTDSAQFPRLPLQPTSPRSADGSPASDQSMGQPEGLRRLRKRPARTNSTPTKLVNVDELPIEGSPRFPRLGNKK